MYSVVLLMALSGGGDAPALGGGCSGLFGKSCDGCCGGSSCDGGCCGNKLFGGMKLFGGKGCCGGCDGCCGGSCHGSCCGGSCHGSCCGGSCHGSCHGGWKSCTGCCGGGGLFQKLKDKMGSCHGCCGGCHGCDGGCHGCSGCVGGSPAMPKADASAPATIVVSLPADAKLMVDGNATTSTSERRVFVSPTLEAGQEYFYTLKVEHKGEVKEERVAVTAGQEVSVKVEFPSAVASK